MTIVGIVIVIIIIAGVAGYYLTMSTTKVKDTLEKIEEYLPEDNPRKWAKLNNHL